MKVKAKIVTHNGQKAIQLPDGFLDSVKPNRERGATSLWFGMLLLEDDGRVFFLFDEEKSTNLKPREVSVPSKKSRAPRKLKVSHTTYDPKQSLYTIEQFCVREKAFTPDAVRWKVFNREKNGLQSSGALVRIGRRVLIDHEKFIAWAIQLAGRRA